MGIKMRKRAVPIAVFSAPANVILKYSVKFVLFNCFEK